MALSISYPAPTAHISCSAASSRSSTISPPSLLKNLKLPRFWPWQKVKVGSLSVSPMGFGTWAWGNQLLWGYEESMDAELQQIFNLAVENGINLFDTADSYGTGRLNGQSERLLGNFIQQFPGNKQVRDNIVIATKFAAYPWRITPNQFVDACRSSLDRIQVDQIGIGQLHWSTANYAPLQERALWDGLVAMYDKGLVRAVGVSNYGPKQLLKIYDYLKSRGVPLVSAQVPFRLPFASAKLIRKSHVRCSAFAYKCRRLIGAILTAEYGGRSNRDQEHMRFPGNSSDFLQSFGTWHAYWEIHSFESSDRTKCIWCLIYRGFLFRQILPGLEPLLDSLREIAQRRRKTVSQVAINWCIGKGTIPIPGVKTIKQAEENLGALGWQLSSDEMLQLESAALQSPKKMVQNIFQTR